MAWSKVTDIAYGRLRSPDLDVQEEFLTNFGMKKVERTANALYMRGTDPAHHIHITEKGDPKFVGLAYYVDSEDDLKRLAKAPGATGVENIDEPGGGKQVTIAGGLDAATQTLINVTVLQYDADQTLKAMIVSKRARYEPPTWTFEDATTYHFSGVTAFGRTARRF